MRRSRFLTGLPKESSGSVRNEVLGSKSELVKNPVPPTPWCLCRCPCKASIHCCIHTSDASEESTVTLSLKSAMMKIIFFSSIELSLLLHLDAGTASSGNELVSNLLIFLLLDVHISHGSYCLIGHSSFTKNLKKVFIPAEAEALYFCHVTQRANLLEKHPDAGKDQGQEEKGTREDEMVGWHQ